MDNYKYVIIVLVYRNVEDLKECIDSIYKNIFSSKIIVVNSFYDEKSKKKIQEVAERKGCIFINVPNKGYSYGNNRGIEYAKKHFVFDYIIISNPDITIEKFDEETIDSNKDYGIIAPKIVTKSGKLQNPICVYKNRLSEKLIYYGLKKNSKLLFVIGIAITKIMRAITIKIQKKSTYQIFAAHGSFVIITKASIEKLYPVYDENLFLFAEEGVLAYKSARLGIKTGQFNSIIIKHKEDSCMKLSNLSINEELKKANIYYYENYVKNTY